jgi:hypothetical protein
MAAIKPKIGKCADCDKLTSLTAGRCNFHYWKYRNSLKRAKEPAEDKYNEKRAMDLWFAEQIKQMPKCCENCDEPLNHYALWGAKAYVAHIVAKRLFKSVKMHPLNRVFLCIQCHTNYDNWSEAKVSKMRVIQLCIERYEQFANEIISDERRYLPDWITINSMVYGKP